MAAWISLVVLSLAVVSTLSFPQPDAEYKIPNVGLGSRSQYYVLHSDGTFKYGYDSGDGLYEQSMAQAPGEVSGSFGYKDPTGADIKLEYTADERGFQPRGGHLPVSPESAFGAKVRKAPTSPSTGSAAKPYSAPAPSPAAAPTATVPAEYAEIRSSAGGDGSYSFNYETSKSSRSESADPHNSVTGQYSFIADDGINRAINYIAGSDTGYIAEGDSLPVGPSVPGAESGIPTGRILPVLSEQEANALAAATSSAGPQTKAALSAVSPSSAVRSPSSINVAGTRSASTASRDASYSFSYDAGDSARSESADADLNVKGTYSFLPPEGHRLTVNYVAGSDTGFVATGDHLPVAPDADAPSNVRGVVPSATANVYSSPISRPSTRVTAGSAASAPVEVAQVRSSAGDDGSYNFAYETSSSSRSESANAQNSVTGQYAFVADDGINRAIKYTANAETGYIAEGDSLPVGPSVPGAESGIPTGRILPILSEEEANALAGATSRSSSLTTAGQSSAAFAGAVAATKTAASRTSDASYSFNYDAGDSARSETADAGLNIKGTYSFVPPEGHRLTVNYVAGSDTGFLATGDHLPVAPEAATASGVARQAAAPSVTAYSAPASRSPSRAPQTSAPAPAEAAQVRSSAGNDGSYSFSYETDSSSRSESADAQNSVTGHYSFVADDGINRKIDYIAGSETGYIAEGDSLPIGPSVPGAESGIPTGRILPVLSEEEANALAGVSAARGVTPLLKASATSGASASPADASYSFSFASDSYSRNEEADADGNIVGSYTYVDEDGKEHKVKFVAGRETGFLPEGYPTPSSASAAQAAAAASGTAAASSRTAAGTGAVSVYSAPSAAGSSAAGSSSLPAKPAKASPSQRTSLSAGHSSRVVGDVLLHQYDAVNRDKYGYVFTALRR
ncbi:serine-rich adhesin for platelets-like [Macrobrachium rosenbergii]|uniref:serine-rich adhesin for platelets-like n=1 Tax=Macrobrachium rosenbergii TaxID=79674 RepID=UPI0034D401D4